MGIFFDINLVADQFLYIYSLKVSKAFIECADKQLTEQFVNTTGIKPNKLVGLVVSPHYLFAPIYLEYALPPHDETGAFYAGRKLQICLFVNHAYNPVTIYWKSKMQKDYKIHDENIDYSDIIFWFEGLDSLLYHKQLYPKETLPFKIKNISYKLEVTRLNMDCVLELSKNIDSAEFPREMIIEKIAGFISDFNTQSMENNREHGVVHNSEGIIREDGIIEYKIDMGSAGFYFMKKLLEFLSKLKCLSKVVVC